MKIKNFGKITKYMFFSITLLLIGCKNVPQTQIICNNHPFICKDLHKDSFCKDQREALILARFDTLEQKPSLDMALYNELLVSEKYRDCIGLKSEIRHVQHTERTTDRTDAYLAILRRIKKLSGATKNSKNPYLAYYHWSRYRDKKALSIFLEDEKEGKIDKPQLKAWLADYYSRKDPEKSIDLYKQAIAETDVNDINNLWITAMATVYKDTGHNNEFYIYHRVAEKISPHPVNEEMLMNAIGHDKKLAAQLDDIASQIAKLIRVGKFSYSPYYKTDLSNYDLEPDDTNSDSGKARSNGGPGALLDRKDDEDK